MGCALLKHPVLLDAGVGERLDVNGAHTPAWHALDAPARSPFLGEACGGVEPSWRSRPRVLLAVGFSERGGRATGREAAAPAAAFGPLLAEEARSYRFTIDLLGLRNLPARAGLPELAVHSFWRGGAASLGFPRRARHPTFEPHREREGLGDVARLVAPLVRIRGGAGGGCVGGATPEARDREEGRDRAPAVDVSRLLGARLVTPVYRVPVVPYLQPPAPPGARRLGGARSAAPFVLMPDLVFQLRDRLTAAEHGALAMTMPCPAAPGRRGRCRWGLVEIAEEMRRLPDALRAAPHLRGGCEREGAYALFVDVFAQEAGSLLFNPEVQMGRLLSQQRLFTVSAPGPDRDVPHYFSPADTRDCWSQYGRRRPFASITILITSISIIIIITISIINMSISILLLLLLIIIIIIRGPSASAGRRA